MASTNPEHSGAAPVVENTTSGQEQHGSGTSVVGPKPSITSTPKDGTERPYTDMVACNGESCFVPGSELLLMTARNPSLAFRLIPIEETPF